MNQENLQFQKRIRQLAEAAWKESRFIFTDFLNEAEYSDVLSMGEPACRMTSFGGHREASRRMVRFGDAQLLGYEEPFPISVLCIRPLNEKFADSLTHRDYLGSILNLGIDRRVIGDILTDGTIAYVFCESHMAAYLSENLTRVRHTSVTTRVVDAIPEELEQRTVLQDIQAGSNRVDAVIAQVYRLSRSQAQNLVRSAQVYINGRVVQNTSAQLAPNEAVSVRHHGKFRFLGLVGETRKGNLRIRIERYQ